MNTCLFGQEHAISVFARPVPYAAMYEAGLASEGDEPGVSLGGHSHPTLDTADVVEVLSTYF